MLVTIDAAMDLSVLACVGRRLEGATNSINLGGGGMSTRVIDQSASEPRLHRMLYFVKYLRAMVLNLFFVFVATVIFFGTGIDGIYFAADSGIDSLKAQMDQLERQGNPGGSHFVLLVGLGTGLILLVFFVWIYLSITNVRRLALKLQAAFLLLSVLFAPVWIWPQLMFSFQNLSPLFSVLAVLAVALSIVLVIDTAIALWSVSRSPETSSFVATLDPRLAPGWWTYLNKLLDLPRTPFRNWRSATAYALSLSGTILLIASIAYLISVG